LRLVKSYQSQVVGSVGIAVRKTDKELLAKINTVLAKFQADGTVKAILAKWGL
jgi:polar amino acid transport system substrate-binding protein